MQHTVGKFHTFVRRSLPLEALSLLVQQCRQQGPLYRASLDAEEVTSSPPYRPCCSYMRTCWSHAATRAATCARQAAARRAQLRRMAGSRRRIA